MSRKKWILLVMIGLTALLLSGCASTPETTVPGVTLSVQPAGQPEQVATGVQLLVLMTVLTLAPAIIILGTSFTRIVIVLSMLRSAIGTPTIPPNQVITGLALLLTFFIMTPVYNQVNDQALQPYIKKEISQETALKLAAAPVREFMLKQTRDKDIELFLQISDQPRPKTQDDISTVALFPAFVISELRTAFTMGFVLFVPFLIIDMVVSSVLLAMGMMMLPPSVVSMPFKFLLFIMADGWYLIVHSLTASFH